MRQMTPWLSIGLVVLLVAAGAVHVSRPSFKAGLLDRVNRVLSDALNREFTVGDAGYRFPLAVAITDIAIASRDSVSRGCLARIPEIRVSADPIRSLVNRRFTVGSVTIRGARIELEQYRDGTWNFSGMIKADPTATKGKTSFPPITIASISVSDLAVNLRTPAATESFERLDLELGLKMGGPRLRVDLHDLHATDRKRNFSVSKIRGRFTVDGDTIRVEDLQLRAGASSFDLTAWMESKGKRFAVKTCKAAVDLRDVAVFAGSPGAAWSGRIELDASADGAIDAPQGLLAISSTPCVISGVAIDGIAAQISLSNGIATIENLQLAAGGGRISAGARLDYRLRTYDGTVTVQRMDIGRVLPVSRKLVSSDLNAALEFRGRGFDLSTMAAGARLSMTNSSVNDIPITQLDASLKAGEGAITIENFRLSSGQASLGISGDIYKDAVSLELETDEIELAQFGPLFGLNNLSGKLRLTGLLSGQLKNPDVIGTFRLKEAVLSEYACHYFDGDLSIKSIATHPLGDGKFTAREIYIGKQTVDLAEMKLELRGIDWGGISLHVVKDSITEAYVVGRAEIDRKSINLIVSKLFYSSGDQTVANSQPIRLGIVGSNLTLLPTELLIARGRLKLDGFYKADKSFGLKMTGRGIDSRRLVKLANLDQTVHGFIDVDLSASGSLTAPIISLAVNVNNLRYEQFTADGLGIRADYADRTAHLRKLTIMRYGQESEITAAVGIDLGIGPNMGKLLEKPITAEVVLRDIGTWVFFPMADLLSVYEGRVDVNVKAAGTPSRPLLSGNLTINQAKMVLRPLGMYLHNVQAVAHFNADSVVVDNVSGKTEGQGTVQLGGYLLLDKFIPTRMRFDVATNQSPIRNIPFIEANVNSQIVIGGTMDYIRIGGSAQVNSALITLPFAPAEEPPPPEGAQKPMDLDLAITGPNGIWLRNKDADIELKIDNLNVRMQQNVLFLSGRLEPLRGVYRFADRTFDITEGQLTFTNSAVINPDLNLKAQTSIFSTAAGGSSGDAQQKIDIFLTVSGTALQPKLSFRSEPTPSLSEQEILTLVGAGMMLDESGGDFSFTDQALRGVDYALGIAAGKIQKGTGLDMLKIKTLAGSDKGAQVTLGKYVTRDVFVSYSQGFSANLSSEFKAEYLFGTRSAVFAQKDEQGSYNLGLRMKFKY